MLKRVFLGGSGRKTLIKNNLNLFSTVNLGKMNLKSLNLGKKAPSFDPKYNNQHFDVAVIGGGSGGLGFVLEAQKRGLKVAVFDFVEPSPQQSNLQKYKRRGTKWGLGGTCVNVGCIPKKLMHNAALQKENILSSFDFGWNLGELNNEKAHITHKIPSNFDWNKLVKNVQSYIKSINFDYVSNLADNETAYINSLASFQDKNTLIYSSNPEFIREYSQTNKFDSEKFGKITADRILISTGGRPRFLDENECKNAQKYSISSDDLFSLKNPPNKTLVVGGGYIALECAGFLSMIGYQTEIMNRTDVFLRGFDMDMANMITEHMIRFAGVKVTPFTLPYLIERVDQNTVLVKSKNKKTGQEVEESKIQILENNNLAYNTVLMAIGRTANTKDLNLGKVGVKVNPHNDKVIGGFGEAEKTSVDNIYAIGDVLDKVPELTPVASKSGQFLAKRLAMQIVNNLSCYQYEKGKVDEKKYRYYTMDYNDYPTTVFTPLEYSCVGLSEDKAIEKYGDCCVKVYHSKFIPLEDSLNSREHPVDNESLKSKAYVKIICDTVDDERVVGIQYAGPNAGEVMQGYAVAIKLGLKKRDLDRSIGIHPVNAEEFVALSKTKDENPEKTSC